MLNPNSIASVKTSWLWQPTQPLTSPQEPSFLSMLNFYILSVPPHLSLMPYFSVIVLAKVYM